MILIKFFFLFAALIKGSFHNVIQSSYSSIVGKYMMLVKIERYNESLFKTINLQTTESFFEELNNDNKEILDIHEKTIKNRTFKFNLLQDKIIFDGGDADLMFYEKLDNINIDKFSGMSFGLNPMNHSFSLLHSLFNKGKLEHLKIAFEPTSTAIGNFYIGGLPQSVVTNKYRGECHAKDRWGCHLDIIIFNYTKDNYTIYNSNREVYFQTAINGISVTKDFINFIENKVLNKYFKSQRCFYSSDKRKRIKCNKEIINDETLTTMKIGFVFEGKVYYLSFIFLFESIFDESSEYLSLLIEENLHSNDWYFGGIFLSNFISVFDYEMKTVSLYSNTKFELIKKDDRIEKNILIGNVILLIITIIGNLYIRKNINI